MNFKSIQQLTKFSAVAVSIGIVGFAAGSVQAETLVGLGWQNNTLSTFDSSTPGSVTTVGVSGLQGGDLLVGIDYSGSTLYGVGQAGNLYTLTTGGAATLVSHFGPSVPGGFVGTYFGMDVSGAGVRLVSDNDINVLLNPFSGAVLSSSPSLNPSSLTITAIASLGSTLYAVDSQNGGLNPNSLGILDPTLGTWTPIGGMGYDVSGKNGFDISGATGIAWFASGVSSSGLDANLYSVDLSTGIATFAGVIGSGDGLLLGGLTVVPEPTTGAMVLLGAGLLAWARRRK